MSIAQTYNPKVKFWDEHPQFRDVEPFSTIYNKDRSPNKRMSSMKLWALALNYDPESDFYNLPGKEEKIIEAMKKNHSLTFSWDDVKGLKDDFQAMFLDQVELSLLSWERRMKERDEFLDGIKWSLDHYNDEGKLVKGTADQLDRLHSQTPKHFAEYEKIYKMVQEIRIKRDDAKKKSNVQELDV